jgi:tyrosine decarboxylase/aspartate 1-decarboxylase
MYWKKYSKEEIGDVVFKAIRDNSDYRSTAILGLPASVLDEEIFYDDAPFLKDAPFISTLVANPNHIGCHTLNDGNEMNVFKGTQGIEKDLLKICGEEIFGAESDAVDGYVASGGTEANIQAMWIYRNYFINECKASVHEIALVYSSDSHYSMPKGSNILNLKNLVIEVHADSREMDYSDLESKISAAMEKGCKYFILIANMGTTMFGSIDDPGKMTAFLEKNEIPYKLHVDAAFGGFIYPFTNSLSKFTFKTQCINSFTIDGHKMLQAPYGTGIFLIRKGYIHHVNTEDAQYIPEGDYTLCGSRSGANAVAVWMILRSYGSEGWRHKVEKLYDRTNDLCVRLQKAGIKFYHNPFMNIVAVKATDVSSRLATKYHLVADSYHAAPKWYKIVVMTHVKQGILDRFMAEIEEERTQL